MNLQVDRNLSTDWRPACVRKRTRRFREWDAVRTMRRANQGFVRFRERSSRYRHCTFSSLTLDVLPSYAPLAFIGRFTIRTGGIGIDPWVLAFTLAVSIATGLLFGTFLAFASRVDVVDADEAGHEGWWRYRWGSAVAARIDRRPGGRVRHAAGWRRVAPDEFLPAPAGSIPAIARTACCLRKSSPTSRNIPPRMCR